MQGRIAKVNSKHVWPDWPQHVVDIELVAEHKGGQIRSMKIKTEMKESILDVVARSIRLENTERYTTAYLAPYRTTE